MKSRKADYAASLNVKFPKSTGSSQLHPATDSDRHRLQAALPRPRPAPRPDRRLLQHQRSPQGGQVQQGPAGNTHSRASEHGARRSSVPAPGGRRGPSRETEAQTQGTPGRRSTHTRRRHRKSSHEATRAAKRSVVNHAARASARGRGGIGVRSRLLGYCRLQGSGRLSPAGVGLELRQLLCLDGPCPLLKDAASSMPPEAVSSPFTPPP